MKKEPDLQKMHCEYKFQKKEESHNLFKSYTNFLNRITRLSKANRQKNVFEDNDNELNKVQEAVNIKKRNILQIRKPTTMES